MNISLDDLKSMIDDAMKKRDRSVAIYYSPDGSISICITPFDVEMNNN